MMKAFKRPVFQLFLVPVAMMAIVGGLVVQRAFVEFRDQKVQINHFSNLERLISLEISLLKEKKESNSFLLGLSGIEELKSSRKTTDGELMALQYHFENNSKTRGTGLFKKIFMSLQEVREGVFSQSVTVSQVDDSFQDVFNDIRELTAIHLANIGRKNRIVFDNHKSLLSSFLALGNSVQAALVKDMPVSHPALAAMIDQYTTFKSSLQTLGRGKYSDDVDAIVKGTAWDGVSSTFNVVMIKSENGKFEKSLKDFSSDYLFILNQVEKIVLKEMSDARTNFSELESRFRKRFLFASLTVFFALAAFLAWAHGKQRQIRLHHARTFWKNRKLARYEDNEGALRELEELRESDSGYKKGIEEIHHAAVETKARLMSLSSLNEKGETLDFTQIEESMTCLTGALESLLVPGIESIRIEVKETSSEEKSDNVLTFSRTEVKMEKTGSKTSNRRGKKRKNVKNEEPMKNKSQYIVDSHVHDIAQNLIDLKKVI